MSFLKEISFRRISRKHTPVFIKLKMKTFIFKIFRFENSWFLLGDWRKQLKQEIMSFLKEISFRRIWSENGCLQPKFKMKTFIFKIFRFENSWFPLGDWRKQVKTEIPSFLKVISFRWISSENGYFQPNWKWKHLFSKYFALKTVDFF